MELINVSTEHLNKGLIHQSTIMPNLLRLLYYASACATVYIQLASASACAAMLFHGNYIFLLPTMYCLSGGVMTAIVFYKVGNGTMSINVTRMIYISESEPVATIETNDDITSGGVFAYTENNEDREDTDCPVCLGSLVEEPSVILKLRVTNDTNDEHVQARISLGTVECCTCHTTFHTRCITDMIAYSQVERCPCCRRQNS